jgi:translocation and assembly module TamB
LKFLGTLIRNVLVWCLPTLLLFLSALGAAAVWVANTQAGAQWLVRTAAPYGGVQAQDVTGTVWRGLRFGRLAVDTAGVSAEALDVALQVAWIDLLQRRLRVRELSAARLDLAITGTPGQAASGGGTEEPVSIPFDIVVERLAVGEFALRQDGQPMPVAFSGLDAALRANAHGANLRIDSLRIAHELGDADVQGQADLKRLAAPWPMSASLHVATRGKAPDSPMCVGRFVRDMAPVVTAKPVSNNAQPSKGQPLKGQPSTGQPSKGQPPKGQPPKGQPSKADQSKGQPSKTDKSKGQPPQPDQSKTQPSQTQPSSGKSPAGLPGNKSPAPNAVQAAAGASAQDARGGERGAAVALAADADPCRIDVDIRLDGSLDTLDATVAAQGAGAALFAQAELTPQGYLPLRYAALALELPDRTSAAVSLEVSAGATAGAYRVRGTVTADGLNLERLSGRTIPPALLSTHGNFDALLTDGYVLRDGQLDLAIDKGSRWNRQPLEGAARARVLTGADSNPAADWPAALADIRVQGLAVDLRLGRNRVRAQGSVGASDGAITLDAAAPELAAFWPGLEGAATAQARLTGTPARHRVDLRGGYTPARSRAGRLGSAPMQAAVDIEGGYGAGAGTDATARELGWRGTVSRLSFSHAGFEAAAPRPVSVSYLPHAAAPLWQWQVGPARVDLGLPGGDRIVLDHGGSRGAAGRWETAGRMDDLVLTPSMVRRIRRALDPDAAEQAAAQTRQARVNARVPISQRRIALDVSWDLRYAGALAGKARVARRSGDLLVPGDPPIALGLRDLVLNVSATPTSGRNSRVEADLRVDTATMGSLRGTGTAMLAATPDGAIGLAPRQPMRVSLDADIADLTWVDLFTGDDTSVGGSLKASVQAQGMPGAAWTANGTIRGEHLRVVRIDDGVRLLDGTLSARLQEDRLIVDTLRFPATLRVLPTETRTRDWVTRDSDAKNGYIDASGSWRLSEGAGQVHIVLRRFPVVQRADRFAMMSGRIDIDAALPRISIRGDVKADAGWASLEVLSEVPSLDGDVVVHRPGDADAAPSTPLQTDMDLNVDLGSRFYLTGMGLDAILGGSLRIRYIDNRLTGTGALRTRSGRIDAYGQRLQLRRGTVTFQGPLDNPLLDIEALRTGEQVEAGVRVSGTAQRPRIDLISYPDVSDEEKLSWLVLGRAPDASGNDTALLVSVGTALMGNGQPFYKQFGLDDVSVRNGTVGSSNSLLPDQTVAGNVNQDASATLASQFLVASKNFANGVTLGVEQALAGSGAVGRLSYRLSRRWSVDVKGGYVNGLELVYRTFLED